MSLGTKNRFEEEDFARQAKKCTKLIVKYAFKDPERLTVHDLVEDTRNVYPEYGPDEDDFFWRYQSGKNQGWG